MHYRRLLSSLALLFMLGGSGWGLQRINGSCQEGGARVRVSGVDSSTSLGAATYFQKSIPNCTVTVYNTGTSNKSTIFADSISTPLANPFTADAQGNYYFYVTDGTHVDICGSGLSSCLGDVSFTGAVNLASPGPIGGTSPNTAAFTTLNSTGGALNGTIGATTPNTGAFTTLTATTTTSKDLNTVRNCSAYATAGAGTSISPWTGWETCGTSPDGKRLYFPSGVYSTTTGINFSGSFVIEGNGSSGSSVSIIKCTGAVTDCLAVNGDGVANGNGWSISNLLIDGNGAAHGLTLGHAGGGACTAPGRVFNVQVTGGATAGISARCLEVTQFFGVTAYANTGDGWRIGEDGDGNVNTATQCFGCRSISNGGVGVLINGAIGFNFYGLTSESNGLEGVKILGTAGTAVRAIHFYGGWLENNNTSRINGPYFQFYADPTSGGMQGLVLEDTVFIDANTGNKHVYLGAVGGTVVGNGGISRLRGNSYQTPNTSYAEIKATASNQVEVEGEDPANWVLGAGSLPTFRYTEATTGDFVLSRRLTINGAALRSDFNMLMKGTTTDRGISCGLTETNNSTQSCILHTYHYNHALQPDTTTFYSVNTATTNQLHYGGGLASFNAATEHTFYTAANNTTTTGTATVTITPAGIASVTKVSGATFGTATNCASASSPAVCFSGAVGSSAGRVVIAAGATSVVVQTPVVTANSEIHVFENSDASMAAVLGVTCNTTVARVYAVTARTAGTSFTITSSAAPVTNPACLVFTIVN